MELFLTELVCLMSCWCIPVGVVPLYQQGARRVISVCKGKLHGVLYNMACSQSISWADNFHFYMVPTLFICRNWVTYVQPVSEVDNRRRKLLLVVSFSNGNMNLTINTTNNKNKNKKNFYLCMNFQPSHNKSSQKLYILVLKWETVNIKVKV